MRRIALGALLLCNTFTAHAYEPETHATITGAALGASRLAQDPAVLKDLGVEPTQRFSNGRFSTRSILELLQDGARFEDTFPRPANHFYDPVNDRGVDGFSKSPDWAVDGTGDESTTKFSFRAAREYMFFALTDRSASFRRDQFGLMFRSLGQVIHHIQDMAQPQHTRLDLHCDVLPCALVGRYAPSLYEKYTDREGIRETMNFAGYDPVYGQHDTQTFNAAKSFWHTQDGKGIADYSNRGFVSAGTNFDKPGLFPSPVLDPSQQDPQQIEVLCASEAARGRPCENPNLTGWITFFGTTVEDRLRPSTTLLNTRTSTFSIFDPDLTRAGRTPVFSLNRFNFYAAHDFLMPRAVAYSAGLINYYFRGKIDLTRDAQGKSRVVNLGTEAMSGRFALYYDGIDGNRHRVAVDPADPNIDPGDSNAWRLTIAPLNPASPGSNLSAPVSFIVPANDGSPTSPRAANEYMLVFRGEMGEEKPGTGMIGAVAAKQLKAEINGTLYVKVLRNNFQEAILKVDKSGTQYLPPGDFNPLETFQQNANPVSRAHWQAAWYKQVEFRPLPFGGYDYTVLSFNIPNQFVGHVSYVRGAAGNFERRQRPITWVAKNTPHGDFEFSFPFLSFDGHSSAQYTRRYTENGQPRVEQGTMPWPSFSAPGLNNRSGFVGSQPVISGDGLRIGGLLQPLAPQESTVGGVTEFRTDMVEHQVVLSLGAVPSAGLQTGAAQPYRLSRQWTETSSHHTNQIPGECGFASESTLNFLGHEESLVRTLHGIGPINGGPKVVEYSDAATGRFGYNVVDNQYPIGCLQGQFAIRFTGSGDSEDLRINATSITAPGGTNQASDNLTNFALSRNPPFGFGHATRPAYDVVGSPPPWIPKPVTRGKQLSLIKALGEKADDAFYQEMDVAAGTNPMKFRTHTVTFSSVADVSPAGEIFFATENGSTVIHEPLQGGIQPIVLPPDVMRILGALWL